MQYLFPFEKYCTSVPDPNWTTSHLIPKYTVYRIVPANSVAVQKEYWREFSGAVFTVNILQNSGGFLLCRDIFYRVHLLKKAALNSYDTIQN